jgi:hypothetical protein
MQKMALVVLSKAALANPVLLQPDLEEGVMGGIFCGVSLAGSLTSIINQQEPPFYRLKKEQIESFKHQCGVSK